MSEVRVRFAPSPTGFLHIGGARTAVFNYLLARHHGGKFLLRIEDTDKQRSKPEYEQEIIEAMAWLGLTPDEPALRQSTQLPNHEKVAAELLEKGCAYRCFLSVEETQKLKEEARAKGDDKAFRSPWRDLDLEESKKKADAGEPFAVRFKIPDGSVEYVDGVHGKVSNPCHSIEDFIIMRSDGTPTYMVAVVADDHTQGVTTVIRGDDHISNTPKQILIYQAMGWDVPNFAHVPLILGSDKKRLSKRHGATAVTEYRKQGYLPEAILSFLALLGWFPGEEIENLTHDELVERFTVEGFNNKSAVFDETKLQWVNGQFMSKLPIEQIAEILKPDVEAKIASGEWSADAMENLPMAIELLRTRCHFPAEILEKAFYCFVEPTTLIDRKAAKKRLKKEIIPDALEELAKRYEALDAFDAEKLETTLKLYAEELEEGVGTLIHPTRLAVSAQGAGPGLWEILMALGKERTVRRMRWLAGFLREKGLPPKLDEE